MTQKTLNGKCILQTLSEFKEPVTLNEIVEHVALTLRKPTEAVRKLVEETLDGGVRYGFVQKHNDYYYRLSDAVDALVSSEEDDVESGESLDSIDSGEIPETPTKRRASQNAMPRNAPKTPPKIKKLEARQSAKFMERAKRERPFGSHSMPDDDVKRPRDRRTRQNYDAELELDSGEDDDSSRCGECYDCEFDCEPFRQRSRSSHRR